jgi:hypothetical protein
MPGVDDGNQEEVEKFFLPTELDKGKAILLKLAILEHTKHCDSIEYESDESICALHLNRLSSAQKGKTHSCPKTLTLTSQKKYFANGFRK